MDRAVETLPVVVLPPVTGDPIAHRAELSLQVIAEEVEVLCATPCSGGTGLGLTLDQQQGNRMGGPISVESTLGGGSTLMLVLLRSRG